MRPLLISHCRLVDGTGSPAREDAAIMIEGNRIGAVGGAAELAQRFAGQKDIETLDATGKTVIPGLIDAHTHLNFFRPRTTQEIDAKWPAQFMGIVAMSNAQRMLAAGFTGMIGGGAQFTLDVWVKRAIRMGLFRGPRVVACSRGLTATGGDGDWHPSWVQAGFEQMVHIADGPEGMTHGVRLLLKEGADAVKIFPSGEGSRVEEFHGQMYDCPPDRECMVLPEIKAAVEEAHRWNKLVIAHTRGAESTKHCIRTGVDIVLHATYIDEEGIEMMMKSPPLGVVPALMPVKLFLEAYRKNEINKTYFEATRYAEEYEVGCRAMKRLHALGIRVVPGGEYGLFQMPFHGENAKDLELFVDDLGFTPLEAICAATRDASHLMRMEREVGTLEAGKLADLVVVDGNPLADIRILQDLSKIAVVVKDGEVQARFGKTLSV